jgi:predicted nucleic acid-binding protein
MEDQAGDVERGAEGVRGRGSRVANPIADFRLGAHALVNGYQLLTLDEGRYRTAFPRMALWQFENELLPGIKKPRPQK